jgi:chromate transporter
LIAWAGFTLPSAIALVLFAYGVATFGDALGGGWLHGLKVVAVAVVAQAVLGMMRSLAPRPRARHGRRHCRGDRFGLPDRLGPDRAIILGCIAGSPSSMSMLRPITCRCR